MMITKSSKWTWDPKRWLFRIIHFCHNVNKDIRDFFLLNKGKGLKHREGTSWIDCLTSFCLIIVWFGIIWGGVLLEMWVFVGLESRKGAMRQNYNEEKLIVLQ